MEVQKALPLSSLNGRFGYRCIDSTRSAEMNSFQGDASAALAANNYELKKRRIAVTIADARVRARNR
jgi:hypothetical protein